MCSVPVNIVEGLIRGKGDELLYLLLLTFAYSCYYYYYLVVRIWY